MSSEVFGKVNSKNFRGTALLGNPKIFKIKIPRSLGNAFLKIFGLWGQSDRPALLEDELAAPEEAVSSFTVHLLVSGFLH